MKNLKFQSLTIRIWIMFTIIILIIISSISFLYLLVFKNMNENAKTHDLKVAHKILLQNNSYENSDKFDELKNLKDSRHFIYIINPNNTKIINIKKKVNKPLSNSIPGKKIKAPKVKRWITGFIKSDNIHEKRYKSAFKNKEYIFYISSINFHSSVKSYLVSYMPISQDNNLLYTVLMIGLLFIGIGFIAAKLVANYISKPLKELEAYTVKIAHKDWINPIKIKNEDEIGRLTKSMFSMQKELKRVDEEEKMFLQSISHDLKTPVMVIMSHAQSIIDGVYIESAEKTAEIIKDEAIRLDKKIKQMLYLNTLDYLLENNKDSINIHLDRLLVNIIERFEVINSNIEWDLAINEITIKGSEDKIQVAIENILDNALRYAKDKISITLKKDETSVVLEIFNDGPNINEKNINNIFDNLYKDKTGNFGLGLTISQKIVKHYHGKIYAVNHDCGVSFIMYFPI